MLLVGGALRNPPSGSRCRKLNGTLICGSLAPGASNFARRATAAMQRTTSSDRPLLLHTVAVSTSPLGATLIKMTTLPACIGSASSPRWKHCLAPGWIWNRTTVSALGIGAGRGDGGAPSTSADCPPSACGLPGTGDCANAEEFEAPAAGGICTGGRSSGRGAAAPALLGPPHATDIAKTTASEWPLESGRAHALRVARPRRERGMRLGATISRAHGMGIDRF
jgi:hypothetical protein